MTQASLAHSPQRIHVEVAPDNLVGALRGLAESDPFHLVLSFMEDGEQVDAVLSYRDLDRRARGIARALIEKGLSGERALLVFPPGLEFVAAFFGCLYARTVAVPIYPPDARSPRMSMARIESVIGDAGPAALLTTQAIARLRDTFTTQAPQLEGLHWIATDECPATDDLPFAGGEPSPETIAFLQYTSGSTAEPKGVVLTHANLMHNACAIRDTYRIGPKDVIVSWLPVYHDMGLIGTLLVPILSHARTVLLSPLSFLRKPLRWLRAIHRHRGTITASPNFAFDLCVDRSTPEERESIDLHSWRVAFSGAEPVRAATLDRFCQAFSRCGFHRRTLAPVYGLAEATLIASGDAPSSLPTVTHFDREDLEWGRATEWRIPGPDTRSLVACGGALGGQLLEVVDPETRKRLRECESGEIWLSGPSVAQGYWGQEGLSKGIFSARRLGEPARRYLRTGDLGFVYEGRIYVTGRRKDLLILNGRNIAPQDVEQCAEEVAPELRLGCGAAVVVEAKRDEQLVLIYELRDAFRDVVAEVVERVERAIAREFALRLLDVVLVESGSVPKTSSGKIQRFACGEAYRAGTLRRI